jgi:hypothetical protein
LRVGHGVPQCEIRREKELNTPGKRVEHTYQRFCSVATLFPRGIIIWKVLLALPHKMPMEIARYSGKAVSKILCGRLLPNHNPSGIRSINPYSFLVLTSLSKGEMTM